MQGEHLGVEGVEFDKREAALVDLAPAVDAGFGIFLNLTTGITQKFGSVVAGVAGVDPAQDWQRFLIDGRQEGEYSMLDRDGREVRLRYQARAHHPIPGYHLSRLRPTD